MRSMSHVHCVTHLCYRLCPLLILANGQRRMCAVQMWHVLLLLRRNNVLRMVNKVGLVQPIGCIRTMGNRVITLYPLLIRCRKCKTYECILVSHLGRCHRPISPQTVIRISVLIQYLLYGEKYFADKKHT